MLCGLVFVIALGCSKSPTAPTATTSTEPPTQPGPPVIQLQWMVAASCPAATLPPSQPSFASATLTNNADGSITASWPYQSGSRSGTLYARFVNQNNVWALCSWDIADV